jgi:GxxExxY protein
MSTFAAENEISSRVIGAAIEVHKALGPGLLESAYEECLAHEMSLRELAFKRQQDIPVIYKNVQVECGFRLDFLVSNLVVVELKAVERLLPAHEAQLITYLKLTGKRLGLLMNFNMPKLRDGIKRLVF